MRQVARVAYATILLLNFVAARPALAADTATGTFSGTVSQGNGGAGSPDAPGPATRGGAPAPAPTTTPAVAAAVAAGTGAGGLLDDTYAGAFIE